MRTILFVDDEPNVLEGLQRMLRPLRGDWAMVFAPGGREALEAMDGKRFDVVVTDMRMPGMDGAELLAEVRRRFPDTVRFVLTGQSDNEVVYRSVGEAHQFLMKPCKPALLKESVDRAFQIRDLLTCDRLKAVVSQIGALPPLPHVYGRLCERLQAPDVSAGEVGAIMEADLAMTAKVLQLVNSAFFGLRQHVSSASQAVALLGLDTLKALVLVTGVFAEGEKAKLPHGFSLGRLWQHSTRVGAHADAICRAEGADKGLISDAFTAGLLHDAGELVLAAACQEDYTHAYDYAMVNGLRLAEAEMELLGCTHAEIGAYLLGIWGLPHPIVEAVAYHHRPASAFGSGLSPLVAVHVADALAWADVENAGELAPKVDRQFLEARGLCDRFAGWKAACLGHDNVGEEST